MEPIAHDVVVLNQEIKWVQDRSGGSDKVCKCEMLQPAALHAADLAPRLWCLKGAKSDH